MSERATTEYLDKLDFVYKNGNGKVGRVGEEKAQEVFRQKGYLTQLTLNHRPSQNAEIDMYFKEPGGIVYSCEIKNNLYSDHKYVWVDKERFEKSIACIWFHINKNDYSDYIVYDRINMVDYISNNPNMLCSDKNDCWLVPYRKVIAFDPTNSAIQDIITQLTTT